MNDSPSIEMNDTATVAPTISPSIPSDLLSDLDKFLNRPDSTTPAPTPGRPYWEPTTDENTGSQATLLAFAVVVAVVLCGLVLVTVCVRCNSHREPVDDKHVDHHGTRVHPQRHRIIEAGKRAAPTTSQIPESVPRDGTYLAAVGDNVSVDLYMRFTRSSHANCWSIAGHGRGAQSHFEVVEGLVEVGGKAYWETRQSGTRRTAFWYGQFRNNTLVGHHFDENGQRSMLLVDRAQDVEAAEPLVVTVFADDQARDLVDIPLAEAVALPAQLI